MKNTSSQNSQSYAPSTDRIVHTISRVPKVFSFTKVRQMRTEIEERETITAADIFDKPNNFYDDDADNDEERDLDADIEFILNM